MHIPNEARPATEAQHVAVLVVLDRLDAKAERNRWAISVRDDIGSVRAGVVELIERLEASNWRLANLLALIPEGRPERAQIEQDMAENRTVLANVRNAS